jgi:predicted Zn-dependent peptidase
MRWKAGTLVLAAFAAVPAFQLSAQFPSQPPAAAPLSPLKFPAFGDVALPNGVNLVVIENREQPTVSLRLTFRAGSAFDPAGKEGLAELVAELLTKGTPSRTAQAISATIEGAGGTLNAIADADFLTINAGVVTDQLDLAFGLLADVSRRATFPADELELARTRYLSNLQAQLAQPEVIAERHFAKEIYGTHPYGRRPTEASYKAITREDVRRFAAARLQPAGALLVIAGDVSVDEARALVTKHFAGWTGTPAVAAPFPALPVKRAPDILLVHRPGSVQSNIIAGNTTMSPRDTTYYAARVATHVLGGGTDSRLFLILREQKGWTYGAFAELRRHLGTGFWNATAEVRTAVTDSALKELLHQINRIRTEVMPDSELVNAKGFLVGSFPLQIETPEQIANQVANAKRLGLSPTYLETYRERLSAVTARRAQAAAANTLRRAGLTIVVVGDGQQVYDKLQAIAPVRLVSVDGTPLTPEDLTPKGAALELDRTQLVTRSDSFRILFQGNPMGSQVNRLHVSADSTYYVENTNIGGFVLQDTRVDFAPSDWSVRGVDQTGSFQGQKVETHLTYQDGRVKGSAQTPQQTGTPKTTAVDTTVVPGTIDDNALSVLLPALALEAGKTLTVNAFSSGQAAAQVITVKVGAPESVTVPAGTFDAFKVDLTGGQAPVTMWITAAAPRRIVKIAPGGAPLVIELVK